MKYLYEKIYIVLIFLTVIIISILLIFLPKQELSKSERRKLADIPNISVENILNGKILKDLDTYVQDHFPLRDVFRNHKFKYDIHVMQKLQSGGYVYVQGHLSKINLNAKDEAYRKSARYFRSILERLFKDGNRYYAIIPTKNYYFKDSSYSNYDMVEEIFSQELKNVKKIDISSKLSLEDYYKSDLHWDIVKIDKVSDLMLESLNRKSSGEEKRIISIGKFYGSYSSALGETSIYDEMQYIDSKDLRNYIAKDLISKEEIEIFNPKEINSNDSYNVFLGGPRPLIEIKNKKYSDEKTLYILRDSFASSIVPRLLGGYDRIVMIDLRYISPKFLSNYININEKDDIVLLISDEIVKDVKIFKK
ncbi:MAG: DHHW family protein [Tissierellia bacterium]|nr:DHHW family protein [Tissierellia bacterium]